MAGWVSVSVPLQAVAPSKASKVAVFSVTAAVPLFSFGLRMPVPEAGTIRSSGFRVQSEAGVVVCAPLMTSSVMLYGARFCVAFQVVVAEVVIADGLFEATE